MVKSTNIRQAIINVLTDIPLSASEISEKIGFPQEKIYYHIKALVSTGIIYVHDTEIINGIYKKKFLKTSAKQAAEKIKPDTNGKNDLLPVIRDETIETTPADTSNPINKSNKQLVEKQNEEKEEKTKSYIQPEPVTKPQEQLSHTELIDNLMKKRKHGSGFNRTESQASMDQLVEVDEVTINNEIFLIPKGGNDFKEIDKRVKNSVKKSGQKMTILEKDILKEHLIKANETEKPELKIEKPSGSTKPPKKENKAPRKKKSVDIISHFLNIYRLLNGYSKAVTFVQKGKTVRYIYAKMQRKGFRVYDQETFVLPVIEKETTLNTVGELIIHVLKKKFSKSERKNLFVGIYSNEISFEMAGLTVPKLKPNELYEFLLNKMSKEFSVSSDNLILDWDIIPGKSNNDTQETICVMTDKSPILQLQDQLLKEDIQLRYVGNIAKLQYDLLKYNHSKETDGTALLIYIGETFSRITLVDQWKIIESRKLFFSLDDFVNLYIKLNQNKEGISPEIARKIILDQQISEKDKSIQETIYEKLILEITVTLDYYRAKGFIISEHVYVGGLLATIPGITDLIRTELKMDVKILNIPQNISKIQNENLHSYFNNVALLMDPNSRLNLIPIENRINFRFLFKQSMMKIALAVLLTFFAALTFFQYDTYIKNIQSASELERRANEKENDEKENLNYFIDTQVINGINRARSNDQLLSRHIVQILKGLSHNFSNNVKVTSCSYAVENGLLINGEIMLEGKGLDNSLSELKQMIGKAGIKNTQIVSSKLLTDEIATFEITGLL